MVSENCGLFYFGGFSLGKSMSSKTLNVKDGQQLHFAGRYLERYQLGMFFLDLNLRIYGEDLSCYHYYI
jgi:hypothetical protein